MEENVTVIIQGPISELSLRSLREYSKEYRVVFSTWMESSYLIDEAKEIAEKNENIKLVLSESPDISNKIGLLKDTTFYYAVAGMDIALKHVDTDFVIRTRSDEHFEDFQTIVSLALGSPKNKEKFICGNIFVRKFNDVQYHIGDHVYIAKTEYLKKAFCNLRKMYDGEKQLAPWAEQGPSAAESILGHAFLHAKNIDSKNWPDIQCFINNFHIFNLSILGDYVVRWGHTNQIWFSDFINHHSVENMKDAIH